MPALLLLAAAIQIWHGTTQRIGHLGEPQPDFNLLGHVGPWRELDRLDAFNAFNNFTPADATTSFGSTSFGKTVGQHAANYGRKLQIGLKLSF